MADIDVDKQLSNRLKTIRDGQDKISISRIPIKTKTEFMKLSETLCKDYGMTLKKLMDFYMEFERKNSMFLLLEKRIIVLEKMVGSLLTTEKPVEKTRQSQQGMRITKNEEVEKNE